jgi:hypothetical protein
VLIEIRSLRPPLLIILSQAGQGDHHRLLAPRLFPNGAAGVVTVQLLHADVQQDHVRPEVRHHLRRLHAVVHELSLDEIAEIFD